MKKGELRRRLARDSHVTQAQAADQLGHLVHEIVSKLRKGQEASIPGLGTFLPEPDNPTGGPPSKRARRPAK
jgi:nucleoid DNA-binding protein